MINENLKHEDLKGVVLDKISIDEFEPKTGEKEDVAVFGFYVEEKSVGDDLANFLEKSTFDFRDVEVTPNPTPENKYMVFIEVDRNESMIEDLQAICKDVKNISGELDWKAKPLLSDNEFSLADPQLTEYVTMSSESYETKEDYDMRLKTEKEQAIVEFICNDSNVTKCSFEENVLNLMDTKNNIKLEFVGFGEGKPTLEEAGLNDLAIDYDFDRHLIKTLESMRGELNIVPINRNIVFHNPKTDRILVAKPC